MVYTSIISSSIMMNTLSYSMMKRLMNSIQDMYRVLRIIRNLSTTKTVPCTAVSLTA